MQGREAALYQRGKYWLAWDRRKDGTLRSPNLAIFWYDPAARRVRSGTTGTAEIDSAMIALDRRFLADRGESHAFCPTCGQPVAKAASYLLNDAIADYRLEIGDLRPSATSIAARLKHVSDYLAATGQQGATCDTACSAAFIEGFRNWSARQPVVWRNGQGMVTVSRPRSPATTEESVVQLIAVLNHAADERRSERRADYTPHSRKRVSRPRRIRCEVPVLADMLGYAAEERKKRASLHAFIVGSICTIARPDAVVDISTDPARRQWWPGSAMLDLNPQGRTGTTKRRAIIPVVPPLDHWLQETARLAQDKQEPTGGWLVNYYGRPVQDVDRAWDTMLEKLGLPREREWRPYILRHSLATLCRGRGALKWELQAWMGHQPSDPTEDYAVATDFPTVSRALAEIISAIEERAPGTLHRKRTGPAPNIIQLRRPEMPG